MTSDTLRSLADLLDTLEERDDIDGVALDDVHPTTREATLSLRLAEGETQAATVPAPRDSDGAADGEPDLADQGDDQCHAEDDVGDIEDALEADDVDADEIVDDLKRDRDEAEESDAALEEDADDHLLEGAPVINSRYDDPPLDDPDAELTVHIATAEDGPTECWYVDDGNAHVIDEDLPIAGEASICKACVNRRGSTPDWAPNEDGESDDTDEDDDGEQREDEDDVDDDSEEGEDEDAPTGGNSTAADSSPTPDEDDVDEDEEAPRLADLEEPLDHTDVNHLRAAYNAEDTFASMADHFDVRWNTIRDHCVDAGIHDPEEAPEADTDDDQPREVTLPDGLELADVQDAVDDHTDLGAVAEALDLPCGRTRVLLVHLNLYSRVSDVTNGYRGGASQ